MNKLREWALGSLSAEAMLDCFGEAIDEKTRTQLETIIEETRSYYQQIQRVKGVGATNERNLTTMDENKSEYVTVSKKLFEEAKHDVDQAEYRRGYIDGLSEGIDYAERLLRAMLGKE